MASQYYMQITLHKKLAVNMAGFQRDGFEEEIVI